MEIEAGKYLKLLDVCKKQHDAIDILFAMLVQKDPDFFPSQSGPPWKVMLQGNTAIEKAEQAGIERELVNAARHAVKVFYQPGEHGLEFALTMARLQKAVEEIDNDGG